MADLSTRSGLQAELDRLGSYAAVGRAHGVSATTLKDRGRRLGCSSPNPRATRTTVPLATGSVEVEIDPTMVRWTDSDLIAYHGLDPELSIVTRRQAKRWNQAIGDGQVAEMNGLTLTIEPRIPADAVLPARTDGWTPKRTAQRPRKKPATELVAIVSDTHAPYHDPGLHDCFLQWLEQHRPARAYDFGDLLDLPTPSRHRTTQGFEASPQESIDVRYRIDAERVAASPDTAWEVVLGNHDERLDHAIRDKIGAHVARIARAGDTLPVMDLGFLLRYDELGIKLTRPDGDYHAVTVEIAPGLFGRHGTKAGKHGGAVKAIERRDASLGQGHDHKQMHQQLVRYDDNGVARSRWMMSWGAMCSRDLGYVEDPDVAQGFTTVSVHADGSWHPEMARWDAATGTLYWRDEAYRPR